MELYFSLTTWLFSGSGLVAVTIPLFLSLLGLFNSSLNGWVWVWWAMATGISWYLARWEVTPDTLTLFIIPVYFGYLAVSLYLGHDWNAGLAYAQTFASLFFVDMVKALELVSMGHQSLTSFFMGVGGAGWHDGLFILPLASVLLVLYVQVRRNGVSEDKECRHATELA